MSQENVGGGGSSMSSGLSSSAANGPNNTQNQINDS